MVIDDWGKIGVAVLTAVMMLGAFSGCIDSMDQIDFDCPPTYYYEGVTANLFFENMEYNDTKMRDYFLVMEIRQKNSMQQSMTLL